MWLTLILGVITTILGIITINTYEVSESGFFINGWYGWNRIYPYLFIASFILCYISLRKYTDRTSPSDDTNPRSIESSLARKQLVIHILSVAVFILVAYMGFRSIPELQDYDSFRGFRSYDVDNDQTNYFMIYRPLLLLGAGLTAYWFYSITLWHFDLSEQVKELKILHEIFKWEPFTDEEIRELRWKLDNNCSDFREKKEKEYGITLLEGVNYHDDTTDEEQKLVEVETNAEIQKEPHIEHHPQDNKPQKQYNKMGQIVDSVIKWFARL